MSRAVLFRSLPTLPDLHEVCAPNLRRGVPPQRFTSPAIQVPSNYFSAAALDEVRREWPEYNKTLEFRPDLTLLLADVVLRWVRWADTAVVSAGAHVRTGGTEKWLDLLTCTLHAG